MSFASLEIMSDTEVGAGVVQWINCSLVRFKLGLHQTVGRDFKLWTHLRMTLAIGGTLNTNTTKYQTQSFVTGICALVCVYFQAKIQL